VSTLPPEQTIVRRPRRASYSSPIQRIAWRRDNAGALASSAKWCFVCCEVMDGLGVPVFLEHFQHRDIIR
jgi:hypothetical protein